MTVPSATSIRVRPARGRDASALIELQRSIYAEGSFFVGDGPPLKDKLERRLRSIDEAMSLYILAHTPDEAPIAWLELYRLAARRLNHVAVLTIAVAAEHRRLGIATRLLRYAYRWAERVGVCKLQLSVRAGNTAARALYEREGFRLEGREVEQIREGERYEDNLLMAKFL